MVPHSLCPKKDPVEDEAQFLKCNLDSPNSFEKNR